MVSVPLHKLFGWTWKTSVVCWWKYSCVLCFIWTKATEYVITCDKIHVSENSTYFMRLFFLVDIGYLSTKCLPCTGGYIPGVLQLGTSDISYHQCKSLMLLPSACMCQIVTVSNPSLAAIYLHMVKFFFKFKWKDFISGLIYVGHITAKSL